MACFGTEWYQETEYCSVLGFWKLKVFHMNHLMTLKVSQHLFLCFASKTMGYLNIVTFTWFLNQVKLSEGRPYPTTSSNPTGLGVPCHKAVKCLHDTILTPNISLSSTWLWFLMSSFASSVNVLLLHFLFNLQIRGFLIHVWQRWFRFWWTEYCYTYFHSRPTKPASSLSPTTE